jgi:hypothetical protein
MIISLFMGDAPLRDGTLRRRAGACGQAPGGEAGELPRDEREREDEDEECDHGAVNRVCLPRRRGARISW